MSQRYQAIPTKPFLKGLVAETDPYTQPPGSFPRGSNLLLNKRGALDVCDGSQLVHAFNGQVQTGRGNMLVTFLFSPIGVSNYWLALAQALDLPIGPPQGLTGSLSAGGSLISGQVYYYRVTAIDGVGGETTASNEMNLTPSGGNLSITLTWNTVPNAAGYNVYRSTAAGLEVKLTGTPTAVLPVSQVGPGTLTVSFIDDGTASPTVYTIVTAQVYQAGGGSGLATFNVTSTAGLQVGAPFTVTGTSNIHFDRAWTVFGIVSGTQFIGRFTGFGLGRNETTTGGTFTTGSVVPSSDTTQQIVLFKMPVIAGSPAQLPVAYNNSNIVAIFPANLKSFATVSGGGGGSGGSGGTGGGGNTGGGGGKGIL